MFEIILENGTVIDGTKRPRFRADVGIRGDRIAAIGDLREAEARERIDAAGKVVCPGFIDVHNHSDGWLLKTPHLESKTRQGFTTELLMSDGISYAPVNEATAREWLYYLRALDGLRMDEYRGWWSLAEFMWEIAGRNVQNAAAQIPYANVRSLACGFGRTRVDDFQMRQILGEIRRGMEDGAVGLSTGLDYIVQCFATTDELVEACRVVAEYGGVYVTHMRYKKGVLAALAEAVEIGKRSGVKVHISHLKAPAQESQEAVLRYVDEVARHEVDLSFDVYPYQPGSTMLSYLLPYEVWEEGPLAALARLRDPAVRARYAEGLRLHRLNLDRIHIAWLPGKENTRHHGRLLSEYVAAAGQSAADALFDLLIEERLAVLCVMNEGDDLLIRPFLQHELYMMGTDGIYQPGGAIHPRQYGSAGRLLGACVRDWRLFSLEDAVHKMTLRPAERFGLTKRGQLREGWFADVVAFDPQAVADRATFEQPHQHTVGIEWVLVNGTVVVRGGAAAEDLPERLPGRFVRRQTED